MSETVVKTGKMGGRGSNAQCRATLWFWSVVGLFATLWILLPTLLHSSYRIDVIELQAIAPQWVWATRKHPMLPAWILESINVLTGRSNDLRKFLLRHELLLDGNTDCFLD